MPDGSFKVVPKEGRPAYIAPNVPKKRAGAAAADARPAFIQVCTAPDTYGSHKAWQCITFTVSASAACHAAAESCCYAVHQSLCWCCLQVQDKKPESKEAGAMPAALTRFVQACFTAADATTDKAAMMVCNPFLVPCIACLFICMALLWANALLACDRGWPARSCNSLCNRKARCQCLLSLFPW